jgi:hypothetical protein
MRCTKCGTESTGAKKFCAECGSPLSSRCPKCVADNKPTSKFCEECGTALDGKAASEATNSPQAASTAPDIRVTPEQPAGDPLEGERKTVTALFADIKGSTELMRDLDPVASRQARGCGTIENDAIDHRRLGKQQVRYCPLAKHIVAKGDAIFSEVAQGLAPDQFVDCRCRTIVRVHWPSAR